MPIQPRIEDPSNPNPSSKVPASHKSIGNEQCCHEPSRSTNFRSTISALCFFANSRNSLGDIAYLTSVHDGHRGRPPTGRLGGTEHRPLFPQVPGFQGTRTVEPGTGRLNSVPPLFREAL